MYFSDRTKHGNRSLAQTNGERTPRNAALHMISTFMNAYTRAFGKPESDELVRIAILHLNRKIRKRVTVTNLYEVFDSTVEMLSLG
jgi:hypothetical protein